MKLAIVAILALAAMGSGGCQVEPAAEAGRPDYRFRATHIDEEGQMSEARGGFKASESKYRMDLPSLHRPGNR